jgi:hypothetical protein
VSGLVRRACWQVSRELGSYIEIELAAKASTALRVWETLVETVYPVLKVPVFVLWTGETDIPPAELGKRIGSLLAKMKVSPLTLKHPVDAVKELKDNW